MLIFLLLGKTDAIVNGTDLRLKPINTYTALTQLVQES